LNDAFARKVKRKSIARLNAELWNKLLPKVDPAFLAGEINEFLHRHMGKSGRNVNLANNLAAYLTQKYSIAGRKSGDLGRLIEWHTDDLAAFLDSVSFKELQSLAKILGQLPRTKKKPRSKPKTAIERAQRQRRSKNRYESRRRHYRDGLIIEEFGTFPRLRPLDPHLIKPPEGPCLDLLLSGGAIRMAGHVDSLENLFGVDRHRFPKSLRHERSGRIKIYYLDAFIECLIHLLENRDGHQQWLPEPTQRELVLRGIIERAHRFSSQIGEMLAKRLRSYLP
jgi:hypothetical protein